MSEKHKPGKDGWLEDGVSYYPADAHAMQTFEDVKRDLSQFSAPMLIHVGDPRERLYIVALDGACNDALPKFSKRSGWHHKLEREAA